MADYLHRLVALATGTGPVLAPLLPSRFEPRPAAGAWGEEAATVSAGLPPPAVPPDAIAGAGARPASQSADAGAVAGLTADARRISSESAGTGAGRFEPATSALATHAHETRQAQPVPPARAQAEAVLASPPAVDDSGKSTPPGRSPSPHLEPPSLLAGVPAQADALERAGRRPAAPSAPSPPPDLLVRHAAPAPARAQAQAIWPRDPGPPPDGRRSRPAPAAINIRIGRVEVRASRPPPTAPPSPAPQAAAAEPAAAPDLDAYLRNPRRVR